MITVFDETQRIHDPKFFLSSGARMPCPEKPGRIDALLAGVRQIDSTLVCPVNTGLGAILDVHSDRYVTFLQSIHTRWLRIDGASDEVIPNIHPISRSGGYPKSAVGQAGFHQTDTSCPISANTWAAAYASAQTAVNGADLLIQGHKAVYSLCRPPGHHAFAEAAGGFCYLNNSAIAAQRLTKAGRRVAILDVDLHHGNGTQEIFYARSDVLTVSIHAHPERFYPFFWGYPEERGVEAGFGANLNICLERGTDDKGFLGALDVACDELTRWGADCVVVALGLDAFAGDPFAGLKVTTAGFCDIGRVISNLGQPTLLVQEGGYLCPELGENLAAVLKQFD
jgi:acetoin utilization deacetylase AcuC-like enzyme